MAAATACPQMPKTKPQPMSPADRHDAVHHRIAMLADAGSFEPFSPAEGIVTGAATVDGRLVHLAAQDYSVRRGTADKPHCLKIVETMQRSLATCSPFIFVAESGGARIQEGVASMSGFGQVFRTAASLSGVVPKISIICGPCAGGSAILAASTDFVIQTQNAQMFLYGPPLIQQATGVEITAEELGGAEGHAERSGIAHFVAKDDQEAFDIARRLLSFLPSKRAEQPPGRRDDQGTNTNAALNEIVPADLNELFDVRDVISAVVDDCDFLETQSAHAANIVAGFARITGRPIGIVANQPQVLRGTIDVSAAAKGGRFVRFCDAFNIPIITFVDAAGFLPSVEQEHAGVVRSAAELASGFAAATVPKIQVVLRKAYGAGHVAMCSKDLGADFVFAWPAAEIAVMDAESAVELIHRKELKSADDGGARRAELIEEYRAEHASPVAAANHGLVDEVIEPASTRRYLAESLDFLQNK